MATNRLEDQELSVLSLHLLQACLVYINTLMIQQVLAAPEWFQRMAPEDLRGLTPLLYAHINPYGAPGSARRESSQRGTLLGVNRVARGTGTLTRGRRVSEAPSTMWLKSGLPP